MTVHRQEATKKSYQDRIDSKITGKIHFSIVTGKIHFGIVTGKIHFSIVTGKIHFSIVTGKIHFSIVTGKIHFSIVTGKIHFSIVTGRLHFSIVTAPNTLQFLFIELIYFNLIYKILENKDLRSLLNETYNLHAPDIGASRISAFSPSMKHSTSRFDILLHLS